MGLLKRAQMYNSFLTEDNPSSRWYQAGPESIGEKRTDDKDNQIIERNYPIVAEELGKVVNEIFNELA